MKIVSQQWNQVLREDQSLWNSLSQADKTTLNNNQPVLHQGAPIEPAALPTFTVYRRINASPLNVAATFWNTANAEHIIPDFSSIRVEPNSFNPVVATCAVNVPVIGPNLVTSTSRLETPSPGQYKISWQGQGGIVIRSTGSFLAVPHGAGQTLISSESSTAIGNHWTLKFAIAEAKPRGARENALKTVSNLVALIESRAHFDNDLTVLNRASNNNK